MLFSNVKGWFSGFSLLLGKELWVLCQKLSVFLWLFAGLDIAAAHWPSSEQISIVAKQKMAHDHI